ncbi:tRNA-His guanylyltransferase [Malassezia pachydermatis]
MKTPLEVPPSFDGRLVMYPTSKEVRDYFSWRQADSMYSTPLTAAHINNLYNTVFWALVQEGQKTEREAHEVLKGTVSADKHEILFQQFGMNYDKLPAFYRKGTTLVWAPTYDPGRTKPKTELRTLHVDIIGASFWTPCELRPPTLADDGLAYFERPDRLEADGLGASILNP